MDDRDAWTSRLEPLIEELMRRQRLPGAAVAIVRGGSVAYARGFGVTDLDAPWPVTPETIVHTASITKTFVAAAALRLAEESRIHLDDPVVRHLPWFRLSDERAAAITVRQLLTHTRPFDPKVEGDEAHFSLTMGKAKLARVS